jgi:hypothetical protein
MYQKGLKIANIRYFSTFGGKIKPLKPIRFWCDIYQIVCLAILHKSCEKNEKRPTNSNENCRKHRKKWKNGTFDVFFDHDFYTTCQNDLIPSPIDRFPFFAPFSYIISRPNMSISNVTTFLAVFQWQHKISYHTFFFPI